MKHIFLTIILSFVCMAEAWAQGKRAQSSGEQSVYQLGLGTNHINFNNKVQKDSISGFNLYTSIGVQGLKNFDEEFFLSAELGYGSEGSKQSFLGNAQLEFGYRFLMSKTVSLAPRLNIGGGYIFHENKDQNWQLNQLNEVKGFIFSYGGNLNIDYKIKKDLSVGLKIQYTKFLLNVGTSSNMERVSPSLIVTFDF